jgi:hypothetical protein
MLRRSAAAALSTAFLVAVSTLIPMCAALTMKPVLVAHHEAASPAIDSSVGRTGLLPAIADLQGDFDKMQGEPANSWLKVIVL